MTPNVGKRAPFELLAFTAASAAGGLVVVELEGRFAAAPAQNGRFTRRPMLVVEPADDRPRLEFAPVRAEVHDAYWRGAYAIPAEARPGARFALGLRGTLLELPAPDLLDDTDRLTALAREANSLRRALEAAEAEAATARIEADATSAELAEARRLADEQMAMAHVQADAARTEAIAEIAAGHEQALAELAARADSAERRATDAEARARAAEQAARVAESGTEVLRAELAEERERSRTTITAPQPIAPAPAAGNPSRTTASRGAGPWIAVAALILFAFVLLGLLAGFLA